MLEALLDKYERMLEMRERDLEEGGHDPRIAMAKLAADFPGALREIDERSLANVLGFAATSASGEVQNRFR